MTEQVKKTDFRVETLFGWFTTSPNPRSAHTGYDAGQRGWRRHAVIVTEGQSSKDLRLSAAMCGLWARHGWGVDLFIEDECFHCQRAMAKREAAGEAFIDLPARIAEQRESARAVEERAECREPGDWPFPASVCGWPECSCPSVACADAPIPHATTQEP